MKVLIIAYYFPPIGGGGVQRALKMAKYLGEFGWEPHVLTVEPTRHVSLDASLLEQLPEGVHIHRCREWSLGRQALAPAVAGAADSGAGAAREGTVARLKRRVFPALKRAKNALLIPDDQILWLAPAIRLGRRVMAEQGIDAIVSTSGPVTNHLVGLALKRGTGVPWIVDYRDPWTQNMHRSGFRSREWLEERLERMVLRESDLLLTVTQSFADNFRAKFSEELRRVEVIHNGFDRADYTALENVDKPSEDASRCVFIYTGIFYKERNPRLLLRAVRELIDEGLVQEEAIRLRFAGVFDYPGYTENADSVREHRLDSVVELLGHLPHASALEAMKRSDILVIVGDTAPGSGDYIPGKLFEYLAIGHPILALSLPGESTRIIEKYRLGVVADPLDLDETKRAVLALYEQWQQQGGRASKEADSASSSGGDGERPSTAIYERREQARMLGALLDELVSERER